MSRELELPAPGVAFGDDFLRRIGALVARHSSGSARSDGLGPLAVGGAGSEFVGFRPYRPGEDLRLFDWSLYSRTRQPFVRVTRREANQRWAILLDTSASMGLGQPGKLQAVAEVAAGLCGLALRAGSEVQLHCSSTGEELSLNKLQQLQGCLSFLEQRRAAGSSGLRTLVQEPQRYRGAGSLFLLGDLMDLEPSEALGLARRGRQIQLIQVLADEELMPPAGVAVHWRDPEEPRAAGVEASDELHGAYEETLKRTLEWWQRSSRRHRASYGVWSSATPFEDVIGEALGS